VGIQMTAGAGIDLPYRDTGGGDAPGIVVGLLVPFDDGKAQFVRQVAQSPFKQRGLAGTGRTDQIQDKDPLVFEQGTVETGQAVVFAENILFDADGRPFAGFRFVLVRMLVLV